MSAPASTKIGLKAATIEALARLYARPLERFFQRRIWEPADVDDLVQEVFLRLARRDDLADIKNPQGFLFQIASNILKDRQRQRIIRRSDNHQPFEDNHVEDSAFSPERVLLGREAIDRFSMALQELPERTRTIFILCRLEGFTHAAAGRALGISTRAVDAHIGKALAHFLNRLTVDL